jgi:protein-tyrosine phosphatase
MAAPSGDERLPDELEALGEAGVGTVVSLLGEDEAGWLGLADEPGAAARAGIRFVRLPTSDLGVPGHADALRVARGVRDDLLAGGGVAIHCRAGIGRSSLLAAVVLRLEGVRPADAWAIIGRARGVRVPETRAQRDFLDEVDATL